jgi:putative aldouronate transport system permease protein
MLYKHSRIFNLFLVVFFTILTFTLLYPVWEVFVGSFMTLGDYARIPIKVLPIKPHLNNYRSLFAEKNLLTPLMNTLFVTIFGTTLSLIVTSCAAYALSRRYLYGRKVMLRYILVTMLFSGGLMPTYMVAKMLGVTNTRWALILLPLVSSYNIFVMRTFFAGIPDAMEESARIDGANDLVIFLQIMIPLSMPIIACIILFTGVGYWNDLYTCLFYIRDETKTVLQVELYRMISDSGNTGSFSRATSTSSSMLSTPISPKMQRLAYIVVCTVPILLVYPSLQRYFVKGIMIGSIKE